MAKSRPNQLDNHWTLRGSWGKERVSTKGLIPTWLIRTRFAPVQIFTLILKLIFYAGKLSDVMYVPPWRWQFRCWKQTSFHIILSTEIPNYSVRIPVSISYKWIAVFDQLWRNATTQNLAGNYQCHYTRNLRWKLSF